MDVERWVGLL